ncbi:MAG: right-handed parallel beta-helix repeat-containing protein [Euryarchaeota archaeon]|nr:right-handed parallel beta-helix repeat-containing protein [Euryarchaeota archaeon]
MGVGDHIFVYNVAYNEDVYWGGKSLSLQGENRGNTIIDASIGTKIGIWASHGDDCVISGFTIQNGDEGINLHASNSTISNNIIFNNAGDGMSIRADNVTLVAVLAAAGGVGCWC